MIEPNHKKISVVRQCELLSLSRSSYYYVSGKDDGYNRIMMNLIDEKYTRTPFYGVAKMTAWLHRQGHFVNQKRVRRLMRLMGLEALYPKPNLSKVSPAHKKYPYLLKNMVIDHPDQVWTADNSFTWWPSWTGTAVMCCPGRFPLPSMPVFAMTPWSGLFNHHSRRS